MRKKLAKAVVATVFSMGCMSCAYAAESEDIIFDVSAGISRTITDDVDIHDADLGGAIKNSGTLTFANSAFELSSPSALLGSSASGRDYTYNLISNNGKLNITSDYVDIDDHHGLAINNEAGGELTITSKSFFIGTDFCCDDHSGNITPADGHEENPSRHTIINNSGYLKISGEAFNDNESSQLLQGKIVHNPGATTIINLSGSSNADDLQYILKEIINVRDIPLSRFIGTVEGSSDRGFSMELNSGAYWLAGKQTEAINKLTLNGGAVIVGDFAFDKVTTGMFSGENTAWPTHYNTLKVKDFYSNGFSSDSFTKIGGIYVYTDLKNDRGDRIIFTGATPNATISLGIINKDDMSGEAITPDAGHRVIVVTAPANTKMKISSKMLVYGNELNKLFGRSLDVKPYDLYSPTLETEFVDGSDVGIVGNAKNWVFTGWGKSGGKTVKSENDQGKDAIDLIATELDNTLKRINDIRTDPSEVGAWLRGENGKMKIRSYGYKYNLMSGGYDWKYESDAAKMFLGFGISYAKNTCDTGIIGDTKSMGYNLYGSWLGRENNDYVDVIVKYGTLDKKYAGLDDNNVFVTGDYDKKLFSVAAKYGRRITRDDGWYYEPSVGLTWGRIGSADFTDSQGINIHADSSTTKMATLGMQVGKNIQGTEFYGLFQVRHDFDGKMHVSVPGSDLPGSSVYDDMGGTWYKVGIGAARKINKNNSFYMDIEKDFGNKVKKPYAIGAGYRYTF